MNFFFFFFFFFLGGGGGGGGIKDKTQKRGWSLKQKGRKCKN